MSSEPSPQSEQPRHLELPVDEQLRRARPLPSHAALLIEGVDEEEGRAFLAAVDE